MKYNKKIQHIFLLLIFVFSISVKAQDYVRIDTASNKTCANFKRYFEITPLFGIIGTMDPGWKNNDFKMKSFGLSMGSGVNIHRFNLSFNLSHEQTNYKDLKPIYTTAIFFHSEYMFYRSKKNKFALHVSIAPRLYRLDYAPDSTNYSILGANTPIELRYFGDPMDGIRRVHYASALTAAFGMDVRLWKRLHFIMDIKYTYTFSKSKDVPTQGIYYNFGLRTPFPEFLMKKNSKVQNYY